MRNASRRFWPCIAAAVAVTAIAVPAASAGVHKYNTKVTITHEGAIGPDRAACHAEHCVLWHGDVQSEVRGCMERRVVLFKARPGADRKLGADRSKFVRRYDEFDWYLNAPGGRQVYAKAKRKVLKDGDVCLAARSRTFGNTLG